MMFEPGLTRLRVRHSTTELPRSTHSQCSAMNRARGYYFIANCLPFVSFLPHGSLYPFLSRAPFFADVWSAGCVVAELLLGQPIFPGDSGVDQLVEIIKVLGTPTREQIREMNPNYQEFKFPQIKAHPWTKVGFYVSFPFCVKRFELARKETALGVYVIKMIFIIYNC